MGIAQTVTAPATKSAVTLSSTNLFCFAVYTENTGSTKKSWDLELLRTNLFLGSHIFGCEAYRVYSDVTTWLSPGDVDTVMVTESAGLPFHGEKRKETGTWINANIFIAVWKKISQDSLWADKDWTVKADADAVFLPSRLRTKLMAQKETGSEPWGEDLFLQRCMDLHGVDKVSDFTLTTDGMCEAFRPEGEKKNKKWTPDCATTMTPA